MGHHHAHGTQRALTIALILNGAFLVVEAALGFWTGSLALLSDAAHMVSDVGALGLALGAGRLAMRSGGADKTFGWRRAEVLGAFLNAALLLLLCGWIALEAVERLRGGAPEVHALPVLIAGILGLGINLGSAWFLHREADAHDLNARGALFHMLADALGSVGAIGSAVALSQGYWIADPIISLVIAGLVLVSSVSLLRESANVLLEFAPPTVDVDVVTKTLCAVEGVEEVHDLHLWSLDGKRAVLSAHLVTRMNPFEVRAAAAHALEHVGVNHSTLQMELHPCATPCALDEEGHHDHAH
ncbi:MAG: cation transporter [Proteobacteria bacterium]|nr:cation transporter [Pseudomonadota bacterium]